MGTGAEPARGWLGRLGPWVGIGTSPAALMMGGGLAEGLEGALLVATLVAGVALLTLLAVSQGDLGQRHRLPLGALAAGALGTEGSRRIAALAMLGMMVGWFGVNVGVAGTATARLLDVPERAGIVLFAAVALLTVWRGIGMLSWAALAAGAATVVLAGWGLHLAAGTQDLALTSTRTAVDPIGPLEGASLVVGFGAAFALRTPDFTRDLARPRQVLWCALAGLALPLAAFGLAGAALQAASGTWNLADVLTALGSPTVAHLFVAVGFFGSVMTNIWSGALALGSAASPREGDGTGRTGGAPGGPALVAVAVAGSALAATGFQDRMLEYLVGMAIIAPGLIVLCRLAWRRGPEGVIRDGWRWGGLAAWGASIGVGVALLSAGQGSAALVAATVALLAGLRALDGVGQTARSSHPNRRAYGDRRG